jgi:hypothetical protein
MLASEEPIRIRHHGFIAGGTRLRVLRVEPGTAELWDGPSSSIVAAFEFAKSRLTGSRPNLGENRKISVTMK